MHENSDAAPADAGFYTITADVAKDIENRFTYHAPDSDQLLRYADLRAKARTLAIEILWATPKSREQSLALTHLEEAVFWANAAIARNEVHVSDGGASCSAIDPRD